MSVCVEHIDEPCKTAKPVDVGFRVWIWVGPENQMLGAWWRGSSNGKLQFWGHTCACPATPVVDTQQRHAALVIGIVAP